MLFQIKTIVLALSALFLSAAVAAPVQHVPRAPQECPPRQPLCY
ncbi:hypothetical protein Vi05172_g2998 [Venturia inaequalis]|nr:hypothetical protein Vi05172_g2998 [Venturia inaequalis]